MERHGSAQIIVILVSSAILAQTAEGKGMDFETYHDQTESTAMYPHVGTGDIMALMYTALGLAGEAGEIANQVKKILRDDDAAVTAARRTAIGKELGDVFWYLSRFMHEMGIDHRAVLRTNVYKLQARKTQGRLGGDGDDREVESPSGAGVHASLPAYAQRRWATKISQSDFKKAVMQGVEFGDDAERNSCFEVKFRPEKGVNAGLEVTRTFYASSEDELRFSLRQMFGSNTAIVGLVVVPS